jgi:hypothetical protein
LKFRRLVVVNGFLAPLRGSQIKATGFAGGYLLTSQLEAGIARAEF